MKVHRLLVLVVAALFEGCAHYPENARLIHSVPQAGYRFKNLSNAGNSDSLQIFWHSPAVLELASTGHLKAKAANSQCCQSADLHE